MKQLIQTAVMQSDAFETIKTSLEEVETKNMPNSIVSYSTYDNEIFLDVRLSKTVLKNLTDTTDILNEVLNVLHNILDNQIIFESKIYLNNINRKSGVIRVRILKPLDK